MIEVYFENIHYQIIRYISEAEKSLKICVAWFTDMQIYKSILVAQNRGVKVYIIVANHEFNKSSKVDFKELLKNNGYVGYIGNINDGSQDRFMHNKFCIIDDNVVVTGSYNWTYKARLNDENIIIIKNQSHITDRFNQKFESIEPQYGFVIKNNQVSLLPIEKIMAKWDKPKQEEKKSTDKNKTQSIFDKF